MPERLNLIKLMAGSGDQTGTEDVFQFLLQTENEMLREQKDDIQKKLDALKELNSQILIKLKEMEEKFNECRKTKLQENLVLTEDLTKCQKKLGICQRQHSEDQEALEKFSEKEFQIKIGNVAIKDELISCQRTLISRERELISCQRELISCQRELISCQREEKDFKQKLNDVEEKLRDLKIVAAGTYYAEVEALYLREAMIMFEEDHMSFSHGSDKTKRGEIWQTFFSELNLKAILKQCQFQGSVKYTVMEIFHKLDNEVHRAYRTGMKVYIDKIPFDNNELALLKTIWKIGLAEGTLWLVQQDINIA